VGFFYGRYLLNSNKLVTPLPNGSVYDIWGINRRSSVEVKEIFKSDQTHIKIYFSWSYFLWRQFSDLMPVRKFSASTDLPSLQKCRSGFYVMGVSSIKLIFLKSCVDNGMFVGRIIVVCLRPNDGRTLLIASYDFGIGLHEVSEFRSTYLCRHISDYSLL
jgi:hypothetical protein